MTEYLISIENIIFARCHDHETELIYNMFWNFKALTKHLTAFSDITNSPFVFSLVDSMVSVQIGRLLLLFFEVTTNIK